LYFLPPGAVDDSNELKFHAFSGKGIGV
jgi:hypothetical protein